MRNKKKLIKWGIPMLLSTIGLMNNIENTTVDASKSYSHIGTFNGSTTFTTSSSNRINPGLFIEVMDDDGNLTQYESEDGVITVPNTKEGTYVTQAKLLGKTKYRDIDTNEILDTWEEGRNLELVSVENPKLKTVGKNLFNENLLINPDIKVTVNKTTGYKPIASSSVEGSLASNDGFRVISSFKESTPYVVSGKYVRESSGGHNTFTYRYTDGTSNHGATTFSNGIFKWISSATKTLETFAIISRDQTSNPIALYDIQIEEGSIATSYEPYKENTITTDEGTILRGIGDVRDELDLMTGKVTKKIDETIMTGDNLPLGVFSPGHNNNSETICFERFNSIIPFQWNQVMSADWLLSNDEYNVALTHEFFNPFGGYGIFRIKRSRLETEDINGFKKWLNDNPITIQHPIIGGNTIQIINLTNTYTFPQILNKNILIKGNVSPTLGSITVPTEALSFTLNPNLEEGQQFIAPTFSISNDSQAPIQLELKSFEQTTNLLNDVLPDKYTSWEGLNKTESKDIALALVPQPSTHWATLNEGSYYVKETSNVELGQIKGNSTVDFKFSALHGQSFSEVLNPQYKLTFVFEL